MLERLRFRYRIGLLVLLAAFGLVTVTTVALVVLRTSERQLSSIETRYVPLLEVNRDLVEAFRRLARAFEDAGAAADEGRLEDANETYVELVSRIRADAAVIEANGTEPSHLLEVLLRYYENASSVTLRLIHGTPAEQLTAPIDTMRETRREFTDLLARATHPDRQQLARAFETTRRGQRKALWLDFGVATCVLLLMAFVSWRVIRRTVRSLREVSQGVERLARGDFGEEIELVAKDEIGDLAREANRTAARLRDYRARTEALLVETQQQAEELARASKYKSAFLATMSHELRTPLNSIMILSNVLRENVDGTLTSKHVELAALINKCGQELLALINEVLDLAKVEAGKQSMEYAPLALAKLEDYMRRLFAPTAEEKQLAFTVEATPDRPAEVVTDEARVTQILKNLLSNAFKFTERGTVSVRVARSTKRAAMLEITVADTGIGIAEDKQAWVFEAFAQADTGTSRRYGGTGLGLAIARQLAIRLGGDLVLDSTLGVGSTFTLFLPLEGPRDELAPIPTPRPPPPEPPADLPTFADKTVLLVDDDMRNLYSLSSVLTTRSMTVLTATDGVDALAALEDASVVDVVLMDIRMPHLDGVEALRQIRARPRFTNLPVVMLTASVSPGERARCIEAGAHELLLKPVDVNQLFDVLAKLFTTAGS